MENQTNSNQLFSTFTDNVALCFVVGLLGIDFLPAFKSIDTLGPQFFYLSVLNLLFACYIFIKHRKVEITLFQQLKNSKFIRCYGLFLVCAGLSVFSANNFSLFAVNYSQLLITVVNMITLIILLHGKNHLFNQICFLICSSLFIQCFTELYSVFSQSSLADLHSKIGTIKGNTGNINVFSASINVKIPFVIIILLNSKNWKKWFAAFTLSAGTLIIILLGSRATYLALILEIIAVSFYLFYRKESYAKSIKQLAFVLLPLFFAFLIVNILSNSNQSLVRNSNVITRIVSITDKMDGTATARQQFWNIGAKLILNNPVFGVGLGNWLIEALPHESKVVNNLQISKHAHNDYVEIAAENGILAGIFYVSVFLLICFKNALRIVHVQDKEQALFALLCLLILIGYSIDCLFNFPLHRPTMQVSFSLLLTFTFLNTKKISKFEVYPRSKFLIAIVILISCFTTYLSYCVFQALKLQNDITADSQSSKDLLTSTEIKQRMPTYPNVLTNSEPFVEILGIYLLNEKKYDEAHKYLNQAHKINQYNGRVEWYKHIMAKENNKKDSAYYYAKQAFKIRPRNDQYFKTVLFIAADFKDTTEILQAHKQYNGFVKNASNWIKTTHALESAGFNSFKLLQFIDEGLKEYPADQNLKSIQKLLNEKNLR